MYISNKPSLMGEYAFSLMEFVGYITKAIKYCGPLGKCQLPGQSCFTHLFPRTGCGSRLLRGENHSTIYSVV